MGYYVLHYTGRRPRGEPEAGGDLGRQRHPVFGGACCLATLDIAATWQSMPVTAPPFDPSAQGRILLHQLLDADDSTAATLWRLGITLPPPRRGRQPRLRKQHSPFGIMASLAVFKRALIAEQGQGRHWPAPRRKGKHVGWPRIPAQEEAAISRDLLAGRSLRSTIRAHGIGSKTVQSQGRAAVETTALERGTGRTTGASVRWRTLVERGILSPTTERMRRSRDRPPTK